MSKLKQNQSLRHSLSPQQVIQANILQLNVSYLEEKILDELENNLLLDQTESEEISLLAEAAKSRKLKPTDLQGASFSISSLGAIGGKFFTPIINSPEVAILGISKTYKKVVEVEKNFEARDYLPVSLSYDHRVINGVYAAQFTSRLGQALLDLKLIEGSFI